MKYKIKNDYFKLIGEKQSYFFGLMLSDGNIRNNLKMFKITLHEKDKQILYDICSDLYYEKNYPIYTYGKYVTLSVSNINLCQKLNYLGCVPNKTFVTKYPKWMPENMHNHFIRGYFDGDGCIWVSSKKDRVKIIITGTDEITNEIGLVLKRLKVIDNFLIEKKNIYKNKKERNNISDLIINKKKDIISFLNFIYNNSTIHFERKYKKWQDSKEILNSKIVGIKNIERWIKENPSGSAFKDLSNKTFGKLTVINRINTYNKRAKWLCVCSCGKERIAPTDKLKSGKIFKCKECK